MLKVKYVVFGSLIFLLIVAIHIFYTHLRKARTESVIAAIDYVIGRNLSTNSILVDDSEITTEVLKEYSDFKVQDGSLIDAWGNKIIITISELNDSYHIEVVSPGRDKIIGTDDDQTTSSRVHKRISTIPERFLVKPGFTMAHTGTGKDQSRILNIKYWRKQRQLKINL